MFERFIHLLITLYKNYPIIMTNRNVLFEPIKIHTTYLSV